MGIAQEVIQQIRTSIPARTDIHLCDLDREGNISLRTDDLMAALTTLFDNVSKSIDSHLSNKGEKIHDKLASKIWQATGLDQYQDASAAKDHLQRWLSERVTKIEELWSASEIVVRTPDAFRLLDDFEEAGFSTELSKDLHQRLLRSVKLSAFQVKRWGKLPKPLRSRQVTLAWAVKQIADLDERAYFQEMLDAPVAFARLKVEFPGVGLWADSDVPVVLYSGKMAKDEREGQIRLFDELERAVLVSTSAVEVGVDFDADLLITEQCPGPDLLQRFGRIGRREDVQGRVILQLHDHQAYFQLRQQLQESPTLSRESFSEMVAKLFPPRRYLSGSTFLEATHWLINDQLGRIGETLNKAMFTPEVAQLASEIKRANLSFAFGLRGTMPQVGLRNGVTLSPFYALRKIYNDDLWPSDSPFELARANMGYIKFVYQPSEWIVTINWQRTLQESRALFYQLDNHWHMQIGQGIAKDYWFAYGKQKKILYLLEHEFGQYQELVIEQPNHPLAKLGKAIQQLKTERCGIILGYGDIYLRREHNQRVSDSMEDMFGTPLQLSDQTWLFIAGDELNIRHNLERLGLSNVEELIAVKCDDQGVILIETMVGAVFQVYTQWKSPQ